ncbi:MAG: hypothetical protein NC115_10510 [Bacteroidales bacterium]|nr:hypothetical protein [Bacteroides sp.]MCM1199347.1 hypothetical protein [Clostridium sp.]MCM1503079.1 hypothetical protein [Bacteroidales bacterium]
MEPLCFCVYLFVGEFPEKKVMWMKFEASEPVYEITSPVFDEITIKLDNGYYTGKEFGIKRGFRFYSMLFGPGW